MLLVEMRGVYVSLSGSCKLKWATPSIRKQEQPSPKWTRASPGSMIQFPLGTPREIPVWDLGMSIRAARTLRSGLERNGPNKRQKGAENQMINMYLSVEMRYLGLRPSTLESDGPKSQTAPTPPPLTPSLSPQAAHQRIVYLAVGIDTCSDGFAGVEC